MNNFKKLLASAMALTMVTSVLPATNVSAANFTTCTGDSEVSCEALTLKEELEIRKISLTSLSEEQESNGWRVLNSDTLIDTNGDNIANESAFAYIGTVVDEFDGLSVLDEGRTFAREISNIYRGVLSFFTTDGSQSWLDTVENRLYGKDPIDYTIDGLKESSDNLVEAQKNLKKMSDFQYKANLTEDQAIQFEDVMDLLQYNINEALGVTHDSDLNDFVLAFDTILQNDLNGAYTDVSATPKGASKSITEITGYTGTDNKLSGPVDLESIAPVDASKKSSINARINKIKNHSFYSRFEDEEAVISIIEVYEEMLDAVDGQKDLLKSDAYEAYTRTRITSDTNYGENKNGNTRETVETTVKFFDKQPNLTSKVKAEALAEELTMEQFEILREMKEEVFDAAYTFETRQIGNYYSDRSDWNSSVTTAQKQTLQNVFPAYLYELVDREEGLFGYDIVAAHMAEVEENYELVSTELDKLVAKNLTVNDRDTIVAVDDAWDFLDVYGDNLTSAEAKVVRRAERSIDELYEAYREKFGSLAETTGWIPMGNGDWKYFEADGTAPTKWICTAPNTWYYVQNGNMMRNYWVWRDANSAYYVGDDGVMVYGPTTVNGYELDANGLWHR